jgi:hypothetical protein
VRGKERKEIEKISSSFSFFEGLRGWFPQLRKKMRKRVEEGIYWSFIFYF